VQNTVQQEPQQQKLVLHGAGKKKYIPFKPDFFSSEAVQLAGALVSSRAVDIPGGSAQQPHACCCCCRRLLG
jgi:hypothetical protein